MLAIVRNASMIGLMAGALALGGCATQEAVEHAQASADQAMAQAQAASSAAQAAATDAQRANTRLDAVSTRLDTDESNLDHLMHHHEHGTYRNVGVRHGPLNRMPKPDETPPDNTK